MILLSSRVRFGRSMASEILRRVESIKAVSLCGWRKGIVTRDDLALLAKGSSAVMLLGKRQGKTGKVAKRIE